MDLLLGAPILDKNLKQLGTLGGVVVDPLSRTVKAITLLLEESLAVAVAPVEASVGQGKAVVPSVATGRIMRIQVALDLVRGVAGRRIVLRLSQEELATQLRNAAIPPEAAAEVPLLARPGADGSWRLALGGIPDQYVPDAEIDNTTYIRDVYGKTGNWYELRVDPETHKIHSLRVTGPLSNTLAEDRVPASVLGSIHRRFITVKVPLF